MADFNPILTKTFKFEGGFQNSANDTANYCGGVLIGTNRGISARAKYNSMAEWIKDFKTTQPYKDLIKKYTY